MLRAKLVPAAAIAGMQKNGAGFAGFATHLDQTPAHPDTLAIPDPASLIQLPWKPEVGWVAADIYCDGKPVYDAPRNVLKEQIAKAKAQGLQMKTGVECEFFLLSKDGSQVADQSDDYPKPCYDQLALMRQYDLIKELSDYMLQLGWGPYQSDHEDANGQFEMNWEYDDVLVTADRHAFFKYMAKTVAEKHGMRATFMPKPFNSLTGNGCHMHVSLWQGNENAFEDPAGELGMSKRPTPSSEGSFTARPISAPCTTQRSTASSASTRPSPPRAQPGRPTPSPTPAITARTWSAFPMPAASNCG